MTHTPKPQGSDLKPWPLLGYAPGGYMCRCADCGTEFDGDKRAVQCLPCAAKAVHLTLTSREEEVETLRLAICGGEDAPGYAMSLPLMTILQVVSDNYRSWRETSDAALSLKAEVERLRGALERLGSMEAFEGARATDAVRDAELLARITFARAALSQSTGDTK